MTQHSPPFSTSSLLIMYSMILSDHVYVFLYMDNYLLCLIFFRYAEVYRNLFTFVNKTRPSLMVIDVATFAAMDVAKDIGIPCIN